MHDISFSEMSPKCYDRRMDQDEGSNAYAAAEQAVTDWVLSMSEVDARRAHIIRAAANKGVSPSPVRHLLAFEVVDVDQILATGDYDGGLAVFVSDLADVLVLVARWMRDRDALRARRPVVFRNAVAAGVSMFRVHQLTGLSTATVRRDLRSCPPEAPTPPAMSPTSKVIDRLDLDLLDVEPAEFKPMPDVKRGGGG